MKELDWANLPFGYMKTDYNVRIYRGLRELHSNGAIRLHQ